MIKKILGLLSLLISLSACTQMPTERVGVADLRPQISFKLANESNQNARVILDGLEVGKVGDYVDGTSALRVLTGNHVIKVVNGNDLLLEERFYIGDGVARSFSLR
ncbi:MAG TPA: hypothetical protein VL381_08590 [Rhodocyclaceae bacterium]|jgi:hypothetical protein|nr:hypothetical protein [Rhodocyclaceae bacterium]